MKVLHLASGNLYGGIETFLVTLAKLQSTDEGLENLFCLGYRARLSHELLALGMTVGFAEGARLRRPWSFSRTGSTARAFAESHAPDLVLAHGAWAYTAVGNRLHRYRPVVLFQHGPWGHGVLELLVRAQRPVGVLANSQFTASTLASFSPARVCPCPVLPSRPARARTEVRAALGNTGEPVVIQTSRLEPWKGHRLLLDALSTLDQPWQLWIAGGQPRAIEVRVRKELEQLARERGVTDRVRFLGERDDLGDFLGAADVFCQPNVAREPFGITVLEAMSVGLPIVATDLGATADPIDLEIGRRVSAAPAALAAALGELLRNPDLRASLAKAARLRFEAFHSPTAAVRQLSTELTSFTRRSEAGGRLTWA